jgi:hypothetical protein
MARNYRPIRTLEDIQAAIVKTDKLTRMDIPTETESLLQLGELTPVKWDYSRQSDGNPQERFNGGTKTYADSAKLLREGWKAGADKVAKLTKQITPRIVRGVKHRTVTRPTVSPVGGLRINIADIVAGGPLPFLGKFQTKEITQGSKIVRIAINTSASAGVSADTLFGRGAACMALIDVLTRYGKETDITLFFSTKAATHFVAVWPVKPAGHRINPDRLAYAIGHPSLMRRQFFAALEHGAGEHAASFYGGYGYPVPLPKDAGTYDIMIDSDCAYTEGSREMRVEWTSAESQIKWVKSELRKQGIDCD